MSTPIPEQFQEQLLATVARLNAEEKMIAVPQGLLGSAVSAIDKKREGMMTVALLRHYAFNGDPAQASEYADAYQGAREDLSIWKRRALEAEAQLRQRPEPVADVVEWHKEGEERTCDIRWRRHDVAPGPLYTAPVMLTDEQIDAVLDAPGNMLLVIADKRERLRMFAREIIRVAAQQPVPIIRLADLSDEDLKAFERDLAASRPDGIIVTPRQQPEPVAWQCLRKGPGRFVVTLERAVADEWARKGWPVRALCECNSQSAFVSATDYLRDRAKDPE